MITQRQERLAHELFQNLKEQFPEIEFIGLIESPADPDSTWLNIVVPDDEDREIEIMEFAAEQAIDILLDQDEHFSVMSVVSDLYDVTINFPRVQNPVSEATYKKYWDIHLKMDDLLRAQGAGRMSGVMRGSDGPLALICRLRSLVFAHRTLPSLLKQLDADEQMIIRWDQYGYPIQWDQRGQQLYPSTGDGAA